MYINKQTLFYLANTPYDITILFDLKTLTKLHFREMTKAIQFCKVFGEQECLNEILSNTPHLDTYLYLDTDRKTSKHRLIRLYGTKSIHNVTSKRLKGLVQNNRIENITLGNNEKLRIKWVVPPTKEDFRQKIDNLYLEYINSSKLLGKDRSFEYEIISDYVIQLTGNDTSQVIVPDFITSVCDFVTTYPKLLKLSNSVRFIGSDVMGTSTNVIGGANVEYIGDTNSVFDLLADKNTSFFEVRIFKKA